MRAGLLAAILLVTGCAGGYQAQPLTQKQTVRLEKELAGKVAGEPTACINRLPQSDLRVISDSVLLYRVSSRLIYRNDVIGRCTGLQRGDTLITQSYSSQICRGDIARVADLSVGTVTGSCALGDFIPYRTPSK